MLHESTTSFMEIRCSAISFVNQVLLSSKVALPLSMEDACATDSLPSVGGVTTS